MTKPEHFDILILGSGAGGKLLAWHAGRAGRRVAVVERMWIGGACPNIACLPSKNEIWSARVAHVTRNAMRYGTATGAVSTDMTKVRQRKRDMVDGEVAFHLKAYKESGTDLIMGEGSFVAPRTIEVRLNGGGTRQLTADRIVINVGTRAALPPIPGLEAAEPMTHIQALELDYAPKHLIVLGGGYVGLEMAQAYQRFGSRVTVIEANAQIMSREDADVAEEMRRILEADGIGLMTGVAVTEVQGRSGNSVSVTVRTQGGLQTVEGSDLLVAAGRIPNTAGIGLDTAGVELDERGYIRVDGALATSAPGIWAVGECAGSPQFTHVSADDFRILWNNWEGGTRSTDDRLVPYCMFTDPPLARVGLSESDAKRQGLSVRVGRLPMNAVLRTAATGETQGFMKVLVSSTDDTIIGFSMIGSEAGEVMASIQTAMLAGLPYTKLRDAVIAHLTIAEGLGPLLGNVPPRGA
jgi:pyruvate/2-oxoglutarate dehydrogenase complex dihydrolipoamide dehydrogenase (E3) component